MAPKLRERKRKKVDNETEIVNKEPRIDLDKLNILNEETTDGFISELGLDVLPQSSQDDHQKEKKKAVVKKESSSNTSPLTPENQTAGFTISRRKGSSQGLNHFSRLSDEILLMIFSWLSKPMLCTAASICKRWRQIAYDETLWSRIDLGHKTLEPRNLEQVLKRGVTVLRLASTYIKDPVIKSPSSYLPENFVSKLQLLDLSMSQITVDGLYQILHVCRNLRKLSLDCCVINQNVCEAVGHNASLETLNMANCDGLTSNGLEAILACCTKLINLNLSWTNMNAETLETLYTTIPKSVLRLNISGCRKNLSDENVKAVLLACPNLVELDISDCTVITGESITHLLEHGKTIERLGLSRCYSILASDFERLSEAEKVQYLEMYGIFAEPNFNAVKRSLAGIKLNRCMFSSIARPTIGIRRTSIWNIRVRD